MTDILQSHIPYDTSDLRLPGMRPLPPQDWILVDDAYAGQMKYRRHLIATRRAAVIAPIGGAHEAANELLDHILTDLKTKPSYSVDERTVTCPDGVTVDIDTDDPLGTIGQVVQCDFCILEKHGDEHVLTAAVLCFPASWKLEDKFQKPLTAIHIPVAEYDDNIARRVQRLFNGIQVGRPLWRFNALVYRSAELHQPYPKYLDDAGQREGAYLRSERQSLLRLPNTKAVVFGIHTFVVLK